MKKFGIFKNLTVYFVGMILLQLFLDLLVQKSNIFLYSCGLIFNYLVIIGILFFINRKEIIENINDFKKNYKKNLVKNLIFWIIGFIVMLLINYVLYYHVFEKIAANEETIRQMYDDFLIYSIFANLFLAPITEEIVFRLGFRQINKKIWFLIISAFTFAFLHTFGSLNSALGFLYIIPYFVLGLIFGNVYYKRENVFDSILIHSLHNAVTMILYFIL